jgi:hypothetical protein
LLTVVLLVDDGDLGPVEEGHDVLEGVVHVLLRGVEVDGELLERGLEVHPRLHVGDVQGLADGLDVRSQQRVARPEQRLDAELHLFAGCGPFNSYHILLHAILE